MFECVFGPEISAAGSSVFGGAQVDVTQNISG